MNTDPRNGSPEELEERLTALLLGELTRGEEAEVRAALARDAELSALYERLRRTLDLVREATLETYTPAAPHTASDPCLDPARRERLLRQLRGVGTGNAAIEAEEAPARVIPIEFQEPTKDGPSGTASSIWLALAACLVVLLGLASLTINALQAKSKGVHRDYALFSDSGEMAVAPEPGIPAGNTFEKRAQTEAAPVRALRSTITNTFGYQDDSKDLDSSLSVQSKRSLDRGFGLPGINQGDNTTPLAPPAAGAAVTLPESRFFDSSGAVTPARDALSAESAETPPRPEVRFRASTSGDSDESRLDQALNHDFSATASGGGFGGGGASGPGARGDSSEPKLNLLFRSIPAQAPPASGQEKEKQLNESLGRNLPSLQAGEVIPPVPGNAEVESVTTLSTVSGGTVQLRAEARQLSEASAAKSVQAGDKKRVQSERGRVLKGESEVLGVPLIREENIEAAGVRIQALADLSDGPGNSPPALSPPPEPRPEVATEENAVSTFSLNVTDVSFKLADASLANGTLPAAGSVRPEEFLNAFTYHDPDPIAGARVSLTWERAQYPFAHRRDVVRLALRTAAQGRATGRPLNLVLVLDTSGSMERADRVQIVHSALRTLAAELRTGDRISVVGFSRTPRLWIDGLPGERASELTNTVGNLTPEGGTNLGDALRVGYETALKHFQLGGVNRLVLLTDGAANLGEVNPQALKQMVEEHRTRGVALDCFGVGWEGYNDPLLAVLSRNGDGRYGFLNSPEEAATDFVHQLAGALRVAAADVKVQVEFNPRRVRHWRQVGYQDHQLTREQFRDNTVDAAEIGAAESGNALYVIETDADGQGPLGWVRVRYRVPETGLYEEHEWLLAHEGRDLALEQASHALRLAVASSSFAEWLAGLPFAGEVSTDRLLSILSGVPASFEPDPRPGRLESMIREAKAISGK